MSGRRMRGVALALLPLTLSALAASAATDDAGARRPRTVLVLSGGGSRGLAHVGVLEVLEREHVPLDAVVGTSMGAAIGGLYAAGMTPAHIREMCETLEWDDLFTDRPPRRDISFRRKQDDDKSLWGFELGVGADGFILPEGLIAGQKLGFAIRSATLSAVGLHEFDDLPTPFRAVATDLDDGSPAVFDHGDLADAIRASMAVPGVFTPVEIDGRDYVDGGLVRNLPVDVGRALGADVIIAVDVSTPPGDAAAGRTVFGVAVQTISLLTDRNVIEQRALLGPRDLLIEPELAGVQATDFGNASGLIARGRRAALDHDPRLSELGVDDAAWEAWSAARRTRAAALRGDVHIDRLAVRGVQRVDPRLILSRMRTRPPANFDFDVLQADLARIWRIGEFEQLDFRIVPDGDERVLVLDATEKSWGPNYLRFGTHLEADLAGTGEFTVLADFTRTQFNRLGAEWKATATVGDRDSLYGEFYQPLDYSGIGFVAPWGLLQHDRGRLLLDDGRLVDTDDKLALSGLDVGVQFGNDGEVRFGFRRGGLSSRVELTTGEDKRLIDLGAWTVRATFDLLDNASFPRHGTFARVDAAFSRASLGADDAYDRLEAVLVRAGSFGRHTFVGRLRYGTDFDTDLPFYDQFRLGGFLSLSGLAPDQLQGDVLGYASLIYYRRFAELPRPLGGGVYGGAALEAGNVWTDAVGAALDDLRPAFLLFGGIDTILGPVYMGYGRADDGESSFYLFLGRPF